MKLVFKPMPWLSILTLAAFAYLIHLGRWQHDRLIWKTALLEQIEDAANAPPLTSLAEANGIIKSGAPLDFRRIELDGQFIPNDMNNGKPFHLLRPNKRLDWRLYQPYRQGDEIVWVATIVFVDAEKANPPMALKGAPKLIGYVRIPEKANMFTPKSTPSTNRWFVFNGAPEIMNWAEAVKGDRVRVDYYIDWVEGVASAARLPVKIPDVPNNHLDYMLTWYSFAFILAIIYLLIHKKAGRLYWGAKKKE